MIPQAKINPIQLRIMPPMKMNGRNGERQPKRRLRDEGKSSVLIKILVSSLLKVSPCEFEARWIIMHHLKMMFHLKAKERILPGNKTGDKAPE
jgi:hypothetical protein